MSGGRSVNTVDLLRCNVCFRAPIAYAFTTLPLFLSLSISAYRFVVRHMSVWLFWCSLRFVCHSFHFSRTLYACACFYLQAYRSGVEQMHRNWKKEFLVGWIFLFDFFFATFSHTIVHSFPAHAIHSSIFCSVFVTRYCHHCEEREKNCGHQTAIMRSWTLNCCSFGARSFECLE